MAPSTGHTMPEEGSSSSRAPVPPTRAMPRDSLRLLPPDSWQLGLAAISAGRATLATTSATAAGMASAGTPCSQRELHLS